MDTLSYTFLILLFFVTSMIGVVTGSNSLVTVPVMFQFGIDPKVAVATNMFGLTFMSIGASIPFLQRKMIDSSKASPLIAITVVASSIGAILVVLLKPQNIKLIVSIAMISVSLFMLLKKNDTNNTPALPRSNFGLLTLIITFVLGVYGGLYSGGYVTMLTAAYVTLSKMSFSEAVALTKLINVFSSLIATVIFMWEGLVDYRLGLSLAITMFIAAYIGAFVVTKLSESLLRRIFVATVLLLAIKTLFDLI